MSKAKWLIQIEVATKRYLGTQLVETTRTQG